MIEFYFSKKYCLLVQIYFRRNFINLHAIIILLQDYQNKRLETRQNKFC